MTCTHCGRWVIDTPWGRAWHLQLWHDHERREG